jgi:acyl-CoA dehydrogenase
LAFKLYDPDQLIGEQEAYGITAALVPTDTPGVVIGRRHNPLSIAFQNGPTSGKDVFVPLDYIIGGQEMAGKGWKMLVELLSVGRAITLPATAAGGGQAACYTTGAYAQLRKQFNLPIAMFDGVGEALTRIAGHTYIMNSAIAVTSGAIDQGEKPAVPSAILKYHCTEMGRMIANDAMDVHGGKGIMMGPSNYLGRGYMATPIAITVEGANILTRSLIIFGQGAIRCHPFVLRELEAAQDEDRERGLRDFDQALFAHIGYAISNLARSFVLALTHAKFSRVPLNTPTRRYYQNINRYSAAFALASDFAMLTLGGKLKQKELLSARLGDVLSSMYLASTVLKHFENQGRRAADLPLVEWSVRTLMYQAQEQLHSFLRNFPNRPVAFFLRCFIFPRGRTYSAPSDELSQKIVGLITHTGEARERLSEQAYTAIEPGNPAGLLQEALLVSEQLAPLEKRLRQAEKEGLIKSEYLGYQIDEALNAGIIDTKEAEALREFHRKVLSLMAVDDFAPDEIGRSGSDVGDDSDVTQLPGARQSRRFVPEKSRRPAKRKHRPVTTDLLRISPRMQKLSGPIIYEVTLEIDLPAAEDRDGEAGIDPAGEIDAWLDEHNRQMLELPGFLNAATYRVNDVGADRIRYVTHYQVESDQALDDYLAGPALLCDARHRTASENASLQAGAFCAPQPGTSEAPRQKKPAPTARRLSPVNTAAAAANVLAAD